MNVDADSGRAIPHAPDERPSRTYGLLAESGWIVRDPTGGSLKEKLAAVKASGFKYVALNARDHRGNAWDEWRMEAARLGLPALPWGRVYDAVHSLPHAKAVASETVEYLLNTAVEWGSKGCALNIEDEAEDICPPEWVAYNTARYTGSLAIVTDYRGYVDKSGYHGPDWTCLADRATNLMEAFDNDGTVRPIADCRERARLQGWKSFVPLLDTRLPVPAVDGARAMYVLDVVDAKHVPDWRPA